MAKKINLTKEQIEAAAKAGREKTEKAYAQKAQAIANGYGTNSAKSKAGGNRGQLPGVSEVLARNNPAFAALQQARNAKKLTKGSDAISYGKKSSERKPGQISALGAGDYGASKTTRFDATANAAIYSTAGAFSNLFGLLKEKDAQTKARDAADSARLKAGYDAMLNGEDINTREGGLKKQHEDSRKAFERGYAALAGAGQKNFDTADELAARSNEYQQMAKEGLGKFGQGVVDFGIAGLQFAGDAAMNAILPGSGLVAMGMRAAGSGAQEARNNGLDINDQFTAGLKSAAIEVLTEKLFGAASKVAYGKGIIKNESLVNGLVNRLAKTDKGRTALKVIVGANEEGLEEVLSDILNPIADRVLKLDDGKGDWSDLGEDMDAEQMLEDYIIGSTLGLFGAGTNVISGQYRAENAQQRAYEEYQRQLVNAGLATEQGGDAQLTAEKYKSILDQSTQRGKRNLSDKETENLERLMTIGTDTQTVRDMLAQSGVLVDDNTAQAAALAASGQKLSSTQNAAIGNAAVQDAINQMAGNGVVDNIRRTAANEYSKPIVINSMARQYEVAPEVVERTYNLNPTAPQAFETAFNAVYQMGQQGTDKESLTKVPVLNRAQAEIAYNMGASTTQAAVDNAAVQGDNVSTQVNNQVSNAVNNAIQEVNENGVRIHNVAERINGQNTEGQILGVETGTGENVAGGSQKEQGGAGAAEIKTGEKVSYKGKQQKGVYYAAEDTEGMKKGRKLAESYGYKVTYFVGGNIRYAGGEFRGVVDTAKKTVMVRADHPDYTAEQIMRHEMGHAAFENGDLSLNEAKEMLLDDFTADELNELIEIYNSEYGGILSAEEAFEEICCDALGRMNIFEGTDLNSESYGKAQDTVRKYAADKTGSKGRALPKGGEKYSREASLTNATKAIQSMGRKSINEFTSADIEITRPFAEKYWREMGTKSPFFRAWFGDWRANDKTAAAVVNVGGGSFKAGKAVNKDTGTVLSWGDVLKKETIVHQSSGGVASRALGAIEDIVENAILLDTYTSSLSSKTKLPGTAFMHSYYTVANYEGTDYLLKLFAEEAVSLKNGEIFTRAYELKDIKKVAALPNGVLSQTGGLTDGNTSTTLTVADIAALVKKYDKSYNPKPASKVVNEDGTPKIVYHQTENEFTVFETRREGAGTRDNGTPFGIFLKSSNKDIGLRGKKQMALYARIENPLRVKNRSELLKAMQSMSSEYAEIINRHEALDREYKEKTQSAMREFKNYMIEWRADNPGVDSRALYDDAKFNELFEAEDTLASEWTEKADMLSTKAKEALTKALESNGYDGVILERDDGSFGRSTDAYIALRPEQVKSATDNIGTFDSSNPDIRYSREPERLNELRRQNERKLAQATAEDAANENERGLIRDYQKQYSKVEDILEKLSAAQQTLTEAEDSGADYDTTIKAKNRFTVLSNQYAREHRKLESYAKMKALQNVLTRVDERLGNDLPEGMGAASANFTGEETVGERWVTEAQGKGDSALHPISKEQEANLAEQQQRAPQEIPKEDLNGKLTSKHVSTIANSGMTPAEFSDALREDAALGKFSHIAYSDEEALKKANRTIEIDGWEQALANYKAEINSGRVSKDNTVMGIALYNNAVNSGDYATAMDIASLMVKNSTNTAQSLQAMRILNKLSPECRLYLAAKSIENIEEDLNERYKDNKADIHVDKILYDEYAKALRQGDEDGIKTAWANIEQSVAQQIDATWYEKLNNFRYLAMLGNPRTHIRNIVGNAFFVPVRAVKNTIAYGLENIADAKINGGIERSKAILNSSNTADAALVKYAMSDYEAVQEVILSGGKYVDTFQGIDKHRTIYKTKILEAARKGNSAALDAEDAWFCKPAYANALAKWYKANGISAEQLNTGKVPEETIIKAQTTAIKEAQKATYRDTNWFSAQVSRLGKVDNKVAAMLIEGVLPFKKTPANILARAVEYSPVGLIKSLALDTKKVKAYVNGDIENGMSPAEFIDDISAGLTGSALMGLGILLASWGVLSGGDDDDEKQNYFDELSGKQNYALSIGGMSITLDWLAPESMPLFVGVELFNSLSSKNEDKGFLQNLMSSVMSLSTPMFEMSMLQSVNDLFDNLAYIKQGQGTFKIVSSMAANYISQYFPTLFGQGERAFGETQRETTYVDRNSAVGSELQYMWGKIANKIPFYDFSQIPYIDAWGRTEETGNLFERMLNNFVNPAYVKKERPTEIDGELERLYDLGETSVYPSRAKTNTKINGEYLTADEYVKYATTKGQTSYELAQGVINSAAYSGAADPEKAYMLKYVYSYADHIAKYEVNNDYSLAKWEMAAYKSANPMQAIIDHAREKYNPDKEN